MAGPACQGPTARHTSNGNHSCSRLRLSAASGCVSAARKTNGFGNLLERHLSRDHDRVGLQRTRCASEAGLSISQESDVRKGDYNRRMQEKMGWDASPYEYHYDRGLYYHEVWRGEGGGSLVCGTMPRNVSDLEYLHNHEGVEVVVNLQENKDFHYWNVDFHSIYWRAVDHGVVIERVPAVDFDPHSLRNIMPDAVRVVAQAMADNKKVYVHCTAGLGRAPAVCIAYLYWWCGMDLDHAYQHLTSIRPCGPKKEAIRGATFDVLDSRGADEFQNIPQDAYATLNARDREALQARVLAWPNNR